MREKPKSHYPDSYDQLISVGKLDLDPLNPREEQPSDELVGSIKETGFKHAVIVRPVSDNYYVTDGWQRVQAGVRAGYEKIPCNVYSSPEEALREVQRSSIQKEWTKYHRLKFYSNYYELEKSKGKNHSEAIKEVAKNTAAAKGTIEKYLRIMSLPPVLLSLLKKKENRTPHEWNQLEKIDISIRQKKKRLSFYKADAIQEHLSDFSVEDQTRIAIQILGMDKKKAKKAIYRISNEDDRNYMNIIEEIKSGKPYERILHLGSVIFEPEVKNRIMEYCSTRRIMPRDLAKNLLKEESLRMEKETIQGERGEIEKVSFDVGNYRVKLIQYSDFPVMKIEGSPTLFYSYKGLKERKWNQNVKIPDYLKDFLNSLNIEIKESE